MFMSDPDTFDRSIFYLGFGRGQAGHRLFIVAALAGVDPELHNAATIDGANLLQRIRHIDLPTIKPVMAIVFILSCRWYYGDWI